ncbi:hypothetical protein RRG08_001874 [Elysia crispata]|uniref:Uncharacterized protein n=1 Tax=Elysia crispata TaxID=231223 RepID=A0AAE1A3W4_9GAST|nr:hypothetical protein RRG08_001874 [Elysia crispata]
MMHLEGRRAQPSGKMTYRHGEITNKDDWLCVAKGRGRLYSATGDLGNQFHIDPPSNRTKCTEIIRPSGGFLTQCKKKAA